MPVDVRIAISCADRSGLLATITGRLFDLGADLGDTTFAVLETSAEFTSVVRLPDTISIEFTKSELSKLDEVDITNISVKPYKLRPTHSEKRHITHQLELQGADRPGLIARLAEVFAEFGANVVRMDSEHIVEEHKVIYIIRFEVWIPETRAKSCLSAAGNVANSLGLICKTIAF
jgi:glycine cleavage system transcriptional repressor